MRLRDLDHLLRPMRRRLQALVARGRWIFGDESQGLRGGQVTLLQGEVRNHFEHVEPYGFTSSPKEGAEAFALSLGGSRDHLLVISVADRRYRLRTLEQGEVALYDDQGSRIVLRRNGVIEIKAAGGLELEGDLRVSGSIRAEGDVADGKGSIDDHRELYNTHIHPEHDGGNTGPPTPQA